MNRNQLRVAFFLFFAESLRDNPRLTLPAIFTSFVEKKQDNLNENTLYWLANQGRKHLNQRHLTEKAFWKEVKSIATTKRLLDIASTKIKG